MNTAQNIAAQIGNRAFVMMGARDLLSSGETLQFKIGRNAKGVGAIRVTLDPSDTYTIAFFGPFNRRTLSQPEKSSVSMVYADQLHKVIEAETGLFLSL